MDSKKLNELLERYWACESSLEEEQQLHEYFRIHTVPEHLKETAALFHYFDENKKKSLGDAAFDEKILEKVSKPKQGKVVRLVFNTMKIAAGLILSTFFMVNNILIVFPKA